MAISKQLLAMTYLYFILNFPSLLSPLSLLPQKNGGGNLTTVPALRTLNL